MWRIGELHLVTGVDRENIKYYCRPRRVDENGVERGGAGLIEPAEKRGRVNYFDEDALFRLAIINLLSKCRTPIDEMRSVLDGEGDFESVLDESVVRLKKEREKIDSGIRTALIMKRAYEAISEEDDEKLAVTLYECFMNELEEAAEGLEKKEMIFRKVKPSAKLAKAQKDLGTLMKQRERLERTGAPHEEIAAVLARITDLSKEFTVASEAELDDPLTKIIELREDGLKPENEKVQGCIALLHRRMKVAFDDLDADAFGVFMERILTQNTFSIAMELSLGEGTIAFFMEALEEYCRNERKGGDGEAENGIE